MNTITFSWLLVLGLFGAGLCALLWARAKKERNAAVGMLGFTCCFLFTVGLLMFATRLNATAQRNPPGLSQDAQIVQKLLRGEEAPIEHYRTILGLTLTARDELKLPPDIVKKVGDYRRYSIHFNTNDTVTVTNR